LAIGPSLLAWGCFYPRRKYLLRDPDTATRRDVAVLPITGRFKRPAWIEITVARDGPPRRGARTGRLHPQRGFEERSGGWRSAVPSVAVEGAVVVERLAVEVDAVVAKLRVVA
jgi:hypothetical protein